MTWRKFKYIYFVLFFLFGFSGVLSFYLMTKSGPQEKPQIYQAQKPIEETVFTISPEHTEVILQKKFEICHKYNLKCDIYNQEINNMERDKLNGLSLEELRKYYPEEIWQISRINGNKVLLTEIVSGLCPAHKKVWHLEANNSDNYIAVYYGPSEVKKEGGIFKVTEIILTNLPQEYQEKIKNESMEFYDEDELIATLDSFSEYLE